MYPHTIKQRATRPNETIIPVSPILIRILVKRGLRNPKNEVIQVEKKFISSRSLG
jgi:hypothetical protein